MSPHPVFPSQGFRNIAQDGADAEAAKDGDGPKDCAPAVTGQQQASQERGNDGTDAADNHHHRIEPGGIFFLEQITDDSAGDHYAGRAAQAHEKASGDQCVDGMGCRADYCHATEEHAAGQQRRPTSHMIAEGPPQDLAGRQSQQEDGQGDLHRSDGGVDVPGDLGEGREVHVDSERTKSRHDAQGPRQFSGQSR